MTRYINTIILSIILLICCCSSNVVYLKKGDRKPVALDSVNMAYVTDFSELTVLRKSQPMSYIGSHDNYHILCGWWKATYGKEDSYYLYAIPSEQFKPLYPYVYTEWGNWNNFARSPIFKDEVWSLIHPRFHEELYLNPQISCCKVFYEELNLLKDTQELVYGGTFKEHHIIFQTQSLWGKLNHKEFQGCECYAISKEEYTPQYPFTYTKPNGWKDQPKSPIFIITEGNN